MAIFRFENSLLRFRAFLGNRKILSLHKRIPLSRIQADYAARLRELKGCLGQRKIRVGFLVNEPAKWQYQSLYEELEASELFEPVVLATVLAGDSRHYTGYQETLDFFQRQGLRMEKAYDEQRREALPLFRFGVDIVFYMQPWYLADVHHPITVSRYALTCYVPYAFSVVQTPIRYLREFHSLIWNMFIQDERTLDELQSLVRKPITNCRCVGYPKLDGYFAPCPAWGEKKKIVIYAPHHAFEKGSLKLATFQHNGLDILRLAQKYREQIRWVFKPHPRFRHAVIKNGIMTEAEIDAYYAAWSELGEVYESGAYFPLFRNSAALITDCGSFLGEYVPTGRPLLHLWSPDAPYNAMIRELSASFYRIEDFSKLEEEFVRVVIEGDDYKMEERLRKGRCLYDPAEKSAAKMLRVLTESIAGA